MLKSLQQLELRQMIVFFLDLEFHVTESDFVIRPGGGGGTGGGVKLPFFVSGHIPMWVT